MDYPQREHFTAFMGTYVKFGQTSVLIGFMLAANACTNGPENIGVKCPPLPAKILADHHGNKVRLGPIEAGMEYSDLIEVLPEADWQIVRSNADGGINAARAEDALQWAGLKWNVHIGRNRPALPSDYWFHMELANHSEEVTPHQCGCQFNSVLGALEQSFGPFGTHADYSNAWSSLFTIKDFDREFRMSAAARGSRIRITQKDQGTQSYYTERPATTDYPYSVLIASTLFYPDSKLVPSFCSLHINVDEQLVSALSPRG